MIKIISLVLMFLTPLTAAGDAFDISGAARVIDGDTLDIDGVRVRLHGIDAPETGQPCRADTGRVSDCGKDVTTTLRNWLGDHTVQCAALTTDRYGRTVARCFINGQDIGQSLVQAGLAFAYVKYAPDYIADEQAAARQKRGLHATLIDPPEAYRRGQNSVVNVAPVASDGCNIKGNISSRGKKIYRIPGQSYYTRTKIDPSKGERWFCSEAEARAAGWQASKR